MIVDGIARLTLDHATDPTYEHTCCFVSGCESRYRVASGWSNLDIIQHVIAAHSRLTPTEQERMSEMIN